MVTPDSPRHGDSALAFREAIALSPTGTLYLLPAAAEYLTASTNRLFDETPGQGLLSLGLTTLGKDLPPDLGYWRDFSRLYLHYVCATPGLAEIAPGDLLEVLPPGEELDRLASSAPPMLGAEYLNVDQLGMLWKEMDLAFRRSLTESGKSIQAFFESQGAAWSVVGRVCFHLAENKGNESAPFAFLATYSPRLSTQGKPQHLALGRALEDYAGERNRAQLLRLLLPVQKATQGSPFLKTLIESGEIYHPLAWSPQDALQFLKDIPVFEGAGVIVRVPDWWKNRHPPRPQVSVQIGGKRASLLGVNSLLDFTVKLTLEGEELTEKELRQILANTSGLALIRGKWVEIDREKLKEVLAHWKKVERQAEGGGISFIEGMRLLSGAAIGGGDEVLLDSGAADWSKVVAGDALAKLLESLRDPAGKLGGTADPGTGLHATLRPYQRAGVEWLWLLNRLGLGGCLADDMGLGKTIQIISLLLLLKREKGTSAQPTLLVVPASLIGNWKSELDRFAPSLRFQVVHPSAKVPSSRREGVGSKKRDFESEVDVRKTDVLITTYGFLSRLPWLTETKWNLVVIDEAQAIKNSGAKQTRAVKALQSRHRIALTGTPVENHLSDLWSLYDFLCPGLLGSAKEFERFVKGAEKKEGTHRCAALRQLVKPYLLRRLKTDKKIIADLPEKTELQAYCGLSKQQAALYQESVFELASKVERLSGIERRGVVLSYLMRLKQICNHPSQWLSDGRYEPQESGKFARLREICEEIFAKQEKVLVFTQFREMTLPLSQFLAGIFGRPGLVLHGETAVKKRKELVDAFQDERGPPFFVLSLKAGGTGLNLTAASHVIHFDRWWNPAVENQATDRAYRIGQKKNVLVHKFVCRGTVEEKIDALIASKQSLSKEVLEGSGDAVLTELSNDELLKLVSLDMKSAIEESGAES